MTNKITVPSELIHRAIDAVGQVGYQDKFIDYTFVGAVENELRAALADPVPPAGGGVEVLGWRVFGYNFNTEAFALDYAKWAEDVEPVLYLVDRAHVTRLQAEVEEWKRRCQYNADTAHALQSELTKARELLQYAYNHSELLPNEREVDAFLQANQSAPADKGQGEPVHMCQKCNGLGSMPTRHAGEGETEYRNRCKLYAEQPAPVAVVLPEDWQGNLLDEMDTRFELNKHDDCYLPNDDTQLGVEFAIEWVASRLNGIKP